MLNKRWQEVLNSLNDNWLDNLEQYMGVVYSRIYSYTDGDDTFRLPLPYELTLAKDKDGKTELKTAEYIFSAKHIENADTIYFDLANTLKAFMRDDVVVWPVTLNTYFVFGIRHNFLMMICCENKTEKDMQLLVLTDDIGSFAEEYGSCFIEKSIDDTDASFGVATLSASGNIYSTFYDLPENFGTYDASNYNDDIPYDKMCEVICREGKADLMLLYGEPGTGKSTLIKHFIRKFGQKSFVFFDSAILNSIQPAAFISYLVDHENVVIILEDCEKILQDRDMSSSKIMSTLLNVTDGVISDILGVKLICTFNTDLANIDSALLRKGRLSLKYEFKKLSKEKTKQLCGEDKELTLADIYNKEENDFSKKTTRQIGFA